jgi:hypothetical protein
MRAAIAAANLRRPRPDARKPAVNGGGQATIDAMRAERLKQTDSHPRHDTHRDTLH